MHSHPTEMIYITLHYTSLTHNSPVSTQIKNVGMVIYGLYVGQIEKKNKNKN